MNYDMPDNSGERKVEVPITLKEFLLRHKLEATQKEVEKFNQLLELSSEELEATRYNLTAQSEDVAREWMESIGPRQDELDKLNTELWRELAVCQAAINVKKGNS